MGSGKNRITTTVGWQERSTVTGNLDDFEAALHSLELALTESIKISADDERAKLLFELLHNQMRGMEIFYRLMLCEGDRKFIMDDASFDRLTQRYRSVLRFFTRFPRASEKSTYEMMIVSDFYYLLMSHAAEPTPR
jgi:hypothetical protein